jgi:hypothetical protein
LRTSYWAPVAGLTFENVPYVDGVDGINAWMFENGEWIPTHPVPMGRLFAAVTNSPFPYNLTSSLFVTGGMIGDYGTNVDLILTENGWQSVDTNIPRFLLKHCMLFTGSGTVWVIGGCDNDVCGLSDVYSFSSAILNWINEPALQAGRYFHSCSMIRKNGQSQIQTKIVVGGFFKNSSLLTSVEIFDDESNSWIYGPQLPIPITKATIVNDMEFGVILVILGFSLVILDTFYYLRDTYSQWEMMPIKLKTARMNPTAFFIPDNITNCS